MPEATEAKVIDLTPTWSEVGNIYIHLVESNATQALTNLKPNAQMAFVAATAYQALVKTLTDEQKSLAAVAICEALITMGIKAKVSE